MDLPGFANCLESTVFGHDGSFKRRLSIGEISTSLRRHSLRFFLKRDLQPKLQLPRFVLVPYRQAVVHVQLRRSTELPM